jgi:hypothetical protein
MAEFHRFFEPSALEALASLKGRNWGGYVSLNSNVQGFVDGPVLLVSDTLKLVLGVEDEWFDIADDELHLSYAEISPFQPPWTNRQRSSYAYTQGQGEGIEDVLVVRESLSQTWNGVISFEINVDCGVITVRAGSATSIVKRGFHGEDFFVSEASSVEGLSFYDSFKEWHEFGAARYEFSRTLIPVGDLLNSNLA